MNCVGRKLRPGRSSTSATTSGAVIFRRDSQADQGDSTYLGLTATPIRRDGQQPIIFMQCGPIRHTAATPAGAPHDLAVSTATPGTHGSICRPRPVFRTSSETSPTILARTAAIAAECSDAAFAQGPQGAGPDRTHRTPRCHPPGPELGSLQPAPFVLHGRMSRKQRAALVADLDALPPDAPRVLLSTGKLVGEGFDHPPLDTLILAMPVSWKGTLQQYAGSPAPRARQQDRRADHRLRRRRPSGAAADVGEAPARLSRDGLSSRR